MWVVWGDAPEPIAENMTREDAVEQVTRLIESGRTDVYAEETDTGETYEG